MRLFWHLLFFPHEKNNHKAFLLQPSYIGIFIAIYLLNQSFIRSLTITKPGVLGYSSEITANKVLILTNQERLKLGLPELKYNSTLSESAIKKAQDMFDNNYWAHHSPQGKSPWDFFKQSGYKYTVAGENLAKDFYDTETMVKAWMNSPTHKDNIISSKYSETGIGVVNGILNGVKTTLVVQHFAHPVAIAAASEPKEESTTPRYSRLEYKGVLSESVETKPMVSPLQISQVFGGLMFVLIIGLLIIDAYHTLHNPTHRLRGSSAGHVSFLLIIFLLLLFTRQGNIF